MELRDRCEIDAERRASHVKCLSRYIDWSDIQGSFQAPSLITPGATIGIVNNGGDGEIRGLSLAASQVSDNLMVGFAGTYQDWAADAEFDSIEGEKLPNAPEFSFAAYMEYAWSFRLGEAYFRVDHQQTDDQLVSWYQPRQTVCPLMVIQ